MKSKLNYLIFFITLSTAFMPIAAQELKPIGNDLLFLCISVILIIFLFVLFQLYKRNNKIKSILSSFKIIDIYEWNQKTEKLKSWSNYSIFEQYNVDQDNIKIIDQDLIQIIESDFKSINEKKYHYLKNDMFFDLQNKETLYLRRFTRKFDSNRCLMILIDLTLEKSKEQELERIANKDYLSSLLTRRAIDSVLLQKINESNLVDRYIVLFDIDDFKSVNDRYGHDIGDQVLVALARILQDHIGAENTARWGGEEFLAYIEGNDFDSVLTKISNILDTFCNESFLVGTRTSFKTSVSCGIAKFDVNKNYYECISNADKALYKAKINGKNRIEVYSESEELDFENSDRVLYSSFEYSNEYTHLMSDLINIIFSTDSIETVLFETMKTVCKRMGIDHASSYFYEPISNVMKQVKYDPKNRDNHSYSIDKLKELNTLKEGKVKFFTNKNEEVKDIMPTDSKSMVFIPILQLGELSGAIIFDYANQIPDWTADKSKVFNDLSHIFNTFLGRYKVSTLLTSAENAMSDILDGISGSVYVVEVNTFKLLYANKFIREMYAEQLKSLEINKTTCWKLLRPDIGKPCEFCNIWKMIEDGKVVQNSANQEIFNSLKESYYDVTTTAIKWKDKDAVVVVSRNITNEKNLMNAQKELTEQFRIQNKQYEFILENAKCCSWTAYLGDPLKLVMGNIADAFYGVEGISNQVIYDYTLLGLNKDEIKGLRKARLDYIDGKTSVFEFEHSFKINGEIRYVKSMGKCFHDDLTTIYGITIDVTEMKESLLYQAELLKQLTQQNERIDLALLASKNIFWEKKFNTKYVNIQGSADQLFGYPQGYFNNHLSMLEEIVLEPYRSNYDKANEDYILGKTDLYSCEFPVRTYNGDIKWFKSIGRKPYPESEYTVGMMTDITDIKLAEQKLSDLAFRDSLTNVYNIRYLTNINDHDENIMNYGAVMMDVKSFKQINDIYGHQIADMTLQKIVEVLKEFCSDQPIVRINADRFMVIFKNCEINDLVDYSEKLLHQFESPFYLTDRIIRINVKIGIATTEKTDLFQLVDLAEIALIEAKKDDEKDICILTAQILAKSESRTLVESQLRKAIDNNEFEVYYQPKISAKDESIVGAEALLRWIHPEKGIIMPLEYIPIAEQNGLIINIGEFVIEETIREASNWYKQGYEITISINLSIVQFSSIGLVKRILSTLEKYEYPANRLSIEITETVMAKDFEYISKELIKLKEKGIQVELDDFGSGYSAMSYLAKMPIDCIKIDKGYIDHIVDNEKDRVILQTLIMMAKKLGYSTLAEGVETLDQLRLLQDYGCDIIQGYYYSKPLKLETFKEYLKEKYKY